MNDRDVTRRAPRAEWIKNEERRIRAERRRSLVSGLLELALIVVVVLIVAALLHG